MKTNCILAGLFFLLCFAWGAKAEIMTRNITYMDQGVELEGYLAYDSQKVKPDAAGPGVQGIPGVPGVPEVPGVPGVLIVHQWMGIAEYEKSRARQLAELGYVAFAADIYGKNDRPANRGQAGQWAGKYKGDRALFRQRLMAGLKTLQAQANVDPKRIAAIGYCFGGTGALELARIGAPVVGVVSFHGGLDAKLPVEAREHKPKVLVLHGADDPSVPQTQIADFVKEMNAAKFDWQMIYYSGAVHSFTQKQAGHDNSTGSAYNAKADARSWQAMKQFFAELFAQ